MAAPAAPDPVVDDAVPVEALTPQELRFVDELLADPRCSAAVAAGKAYPDASPDNYASLGYQAKNRPQVAAEIRRRLAPAMAKLGLERDHVLRHLASGLNYDVADAYNADGSFKALRDMPIDVRRQIESIEVEELTAGDLVIGKVRKVKFAPRRQYVELAARHHKLLVDKIEIHDATGRADRIRRARERAGST